jgi:hypothetical protein
MKLELNNKRNYRLKNTSLNDLWVIEEMRGKMQYVLKSNKNENITYQHLWNTAKSMLRGKFIVMRVHVSN